MASASASASAASAADATNIVRAAQGYLQRILKPRDKAKEVQGMKCLLLDKETKSFVSLVFSMGEILSRDVFLVEQLEAQHESLGHLKALCLLRPTQANVRELARHLREPKFLEYVSAGPRGRAPPAARNGGCRFDGARGGRGSGAGRAALVVAS